MKKLFLTGIAALLLATGTAHAINLEMWVCPGGLTITQEVVKDEQWRKTGDAGYSFTISGIDGEGIHGKKSDRLRGRFTEKSVYLNGRRCQPCWTSDCSKDRWKHCKESNPNADCKP
jgi:hypothetical protein